LSETGELPRTAILLALLILLPCPVRSQGPGAPGSGRGFSPPAPLALRALPDSVTTGSEETPRGGKSSWTAVGLSAVLPGAGQVYTENYWKVPLILGLGGYWVYEWGKNNDRYREYRDLYTQSIADSPPFGDERYLTLREAYKDQRDSFTWYLGLLYLLNVVDAYVDAELYDFDVGPDLGMGGGGVRASLRIHL
jgi:hypothetical protein